MRRQIINILGRHLKSLEANTFEKFKKMFCKMKPPRGKKKIRMCHLKNKSAKKVAEIIVESYTVRNGPPRVIEVFKKMGLNQTRIDLQKDLKQVKKKIQKKRSITKVQTAERKHLILEQDDKAQSNNKVSQKESSIVDGIPTSPQTPEKENIGVPRPPAAQNDAKCRILTSLDNQEELNNGDPRHETAINMDAQIPKPDTTQEENPSDNQISLTDQAEAKGNVARLEKGQEGTTIVLISNIQQERQEALLTHRESQVRKITAIKNATNSNLQEQNHNGGNPKEDVLVDKEAEDKDPKVKAIRVQPHKRSASKNSTGGKQSNSQAKGPTTKRKCNRQQAKDCGKHFVDEHRYDLINRMTNIDSVLDELLDAEILTQEQYDTVRAERTDQGKMRSLYDYEKSWGTPEKDTFLCFLEKHNKPLINDLKKKNKKKKSRKK